MPLAGQVIRAIDFAPLASASVPNQFENVAFAAFTPTTPALEVTFMAPTSGIVRLNIKFDADWDVGLANDVMRADVEIRETDASGVLIHAPNIGDGQGVVWTYPGDVNTTVFVQLSGWRLQTELIPGGTYWAQLQFHTGATSVIDIRNQLVVVQGSP